MSQLHQNLELPKNMLSEPECFEFHTDYAYNDEDKYQHVDTTRNPERFPGAIADRSILSALDCQKSCQESDECQFWSFSDHGCFRKISKEYPGNFSGEISGPKYCGQ